LLKQTIAQLFAKFLAEQNIKRVYLMSGGMITYLIDAIHELNNTRIVCVHHEQAAAFAAEAEGRLSDVPGVAIATSGPGATNLLTGIASCYFDSVPTVFITGQVGRNDYRRSAEVRQSGFQETNIVDIAKPITKYCVQAQSYSHAITSLEYAFKLARCGRPGPVLIDLPTDIQVLTEPDGDMPPSFDNSHSVCISEQDPSIVKLFSLLLSAKRPLVLIGGGVRTAHCNNLMQILLEALQIPAVCTLMGLDALSGNHPLRIGFIGVYGNRWANWALARADFLLVLGSRLDVRQTGMDIPKFLDNKTLYRVDCDEGELSGRIKANYSIAADLSDFLKVAQGFVTDNNISPLPTEHWKATIRRVQSLSDDVTEIDTNAINPNSFMRDLSVASPFAAAFISDVGNNQMWAAQSLRTREGQRILNSGGLGAMGYSLPAAIGAAFSTGRPVVSISGDGGLLVNIQELQTISRNRLPVKIVVLNNHVLGLVRGYQDKFFGGRVVATQWGYDAPNFVALARAFNIPAMCVEANDSVAMGLAELWRDPQSPYLLEVKIPHDMIVLPNMMFGNSLDEMYPPIDLNVSDDFA
jgi:acetolactate synthase-1/2/3 large subunit